MIVCLCKGVRSSAIADEVRRGNRTLRGIMQACGAGSCCGACHDEIRRMAESTGRPARDRNSTPPAGQD